MITDLEAENDHLYPLKKRHQWEQVNDVTWKLAAADFTNVPASHGQWAGYRTAKAWAWVINVGSPVGAPGHHVWLVRCEDRSIGRTTIAKAKAAAVEMMTNLSMGTLIDDPVDHLNRMQACLADQPAT